MREQKVSARYANALMDIATDTKSIDEVASDLDFIKATMQDNKDLSAIAFSPVVSEYKKKSIFEEIFSKKINALTLKFLQLIIEKNRLDLIYNIRNEFIKLYNIKFSRQPVTITSAYELTQDMSDTLLKKLTESTGMTILPDYKIDKKLKGGLKIRINDIIYDASIQTQLKNLRTRLMAK